MGSPQPCNDEECPLARFIELLIRDPNLVPINVKDWRKVPNEWKEVLYETACAISERNKANRAKLTMSTLLGRSHAVGTTVISIRRFAITRAVQLFRPSSGSSPVEAICRLFAYRGSKGYHIYLKRRALTKRSSRIYRTVFLCLYLSLDLWFCHGIRAKFYAIREFFSIGVPDASLSAIQEVHQTSQRDQFLMKLRNEFENARSSLMNWTPSPSLDIYLNELLREEQRCLTQATLEQQQGSTGAISVAYATQTKPRGRDMSTIQCYSCKELGHIANQCQKKFCNYCKGKGHVITECRRRPQNRNLRAYHTTVEDSVPISVASASTMNSQLASSCSTTSTLTPETVQQMILSAFSALGLTGKNKSFSKLWFLDSGASNHMTFSSENLLNVQKYDGNLQVQTANGESLPITAVGDISPSPPLQNVFYSPSLSANLISVGQLVDNDCDVSFSRSGCIVKDQVSGKIIVTGPKCGRLFPLRLPTSPRCSSIFSLFCPLAKNNCQMWHNRLGHPNSKTLLLPLMSSLPDFSDDESPSLTTSRFTPGFVYERRRQPDESTNGTCHDSTLAPALDIDPQPLRSVASDELSSSGNMVHGFGSLKGRLDMEEHSKITPLASRVSKNPISLHHVIPLLGLVC
ncbi:hypothetical protein HHK36_032419 [Tetracentron sinense]|uniref:CCHC-type domain-containing protein n=1 Tax=Tetracentron sinense TaxID=13715 RepID=A0A835CXP1_TETSI|nr:hypothetical protein HHK36_032419 [Tetracentron sinense]